MLGLAIYRVFGSRCGFAGPFEPFVARSMQRLEVVFRRDEASTGFRLGEIGEEAVPGEIIRFSAAGGQMENWVSSRFKFIGRDT